MTLRVNGPIAMAIVDDYDVVVMGLANMFDQYSDRVVVAELNPNKRELITMLIRFRTQAVASVTATPASAVESTIDFRVSRAARRLHRADIRR